MKFKRKLCLRLKKSALRHCERKKRFSKWMEEIQASVVSWRNISWELPECWDSVSSWVTAIMRKSNVHFKCELRRLYTVLPPIAEQVLCLGCFPPSSLATARLCKLQWLFPCLVSRLLHQWSSIVRGCWRPRKKCLRRNGICRPLRVILNGVSANQQKKNLFPANMPGKLWSWIGIRCMSWETWLLTL